MLSCLVRTLKGVGVLDTAPVYQPLAGFTRCATGVADARGSPTLLQALRRNEPFGLLTYLQA